ncbi:unnamed protein product [Zymoseptoria tritici ST99CH_1E4]|nr:uncharacterized protein MYCGRDRAFT_94804 [Zymoseptoria tritici IPO323]EGP85878.1 hypothetical protein MYCGRDRAFT_94804 [Zymoseptoria tritici IPO323]SMR55746.1 unnamed protein product [Zymoseptoria tritici ST99CH_1E4]
MDGMRDLTFDNLELLLDLPVELKIMVAENFLFDIHLKVNAVRPRQGDRLITHHVVWVNEEEWAPFRVFAGMSPQTSSIAWKAFRDARTAGRIRIILDMEKHTINPSHWIPRSTATRPVPMRFFDEFTRLEATTPITMGTEHDEDERGFEVVVQRVSVVYDISPPIAPPQPGDNDRIISIRNEVLMDTSTTMNAPLFAAANEAITYGIHHPIPSPTIPTPYLTPLTPKGLWSLGNLLTHRARKIARHYQSEVHGTSRVWVENHVNSLNWISRVEKMKAEKAKADEEKAEEADDEYTDDEE